METNNLYRYGIHHVRYVTSFSLTVEHTSVERLDQVQFLKRGL